MTAAPRNVAAAALGGAVLGLILSPLPFLILGATSGEFRVGFYAIAVLPFLLGSGFLLWRYISRSTDDRTRTIPLLVGEVMCWIVVGCFLYLVSGINLLTGLERWGAACGWFLAGWAVSLPLMLKRRTALERRLRPVPKRAAVAVVVVLVLTAAVVLLADFVTPPRFIGGHR